MGLRSLLGLPPLPEPTDLTGAASWTKVEDRLRQLKADKGFNLLPGSDRVKLEVSALFATAQSLVVPGDAAKNLNDAIGEAIQTILAIKEPLKAFQADKAEAEVILGRAVANGMNELVHKIHSGAFDLYVREVLTNVTDFRNRMAILLATLKKFESDRSDGQAKGFVESGIEQVRSDAQRALAIDTETPEIKAAHDKLEKRLALLNKKNDAGKYSDALLNMFKIDTLCYEITSHAGEVAEAANRREEVLRKRLAMKKDVDDARLVFATDPTDASIVSLFEITDRQFEGAMVEHDYKAAEALLAQLESRTKRVLEIRKKSETALQNANQMDQLAKEKTRLSAQISALQQTTYQTPRVTQQMIDLYQDLILPSQTFWAQINGTDMAAIQKAFKDYSDAAERFMAAAKASAAEIEAHKDTQATINNLVMARYLALQRVASMSPAFTATMQTVNGLKLQLDQLLNHREYKQAVDQANVLVTEIGKAEALAVENQQALQRQALMRQKYTSNQANLTKVQNSPAFTDEFFRRTEAFRTNFTAFIALFNAGDIAGDAALDALILEVDALLVLKVENDKARAVSEASARKKYGDLLGPYQAAVALLQKFLPEQQAVRSELVSLGGMMTNTLNTEHFQKVLELGGQMDVLLAHIDREKGDWEFDLFAKERGALKQKADAMALYDGVKTMSPVTTVIFGLQESCSATILSIGQFEAAKSWGELIAECNKLTQLVGQLSAQKPQHDILVVDHQWIATHSAKLRADAVKATMEWASTQELMEILDRIRYRLNAADEYAKRHDPQTARQHWEQIKTLTEEWTRRELENLGGFDDVAKAVRQHWDAMQPTLMICGQILPITNEIKVAVGPYGKLWGKVTGAMGCGEWAYALELLPKLDEAAKALASLKGAYDAAEPLAESRRVDAKRKLGKLIQRGELAAKPAKEKLALLEDLRATGKVLEPDEKALQRVIYENLEFSDEFKRKEEERREALVSKLVEDKEIREARDGWAAKTDDQRLAIITKAIAAESEVYGIPTPPIRLFCDPKGPNGAFHGNSCTINLNSHPSLTWLDYPKAMDTALHENAHHYQHVLAQRLADGLLDEDSEEHLQAQLFAINESGGGYMTFDDLLALGDRAEALRIYKTQPMEKHSYETGEGVARGIMEPGNVARGIFLSLTKED